MQKRSKPPAASAAGVRAFQPLRPVAFAVLASLADGAAPGIAILDHVNDTVPGRALVGPGSLYRLMRELRQAGLIGRVDPPAGDGPGDERRAHHALTPLGRAVLYAEAARLRRTLAGAGLLRAARRSAR